MNISSRTPEGFPSHCAMCGVETRLEFSADAGDATCPNCGHLLWFTAELFKTYQHRMAGLLGVEAERITPEASFVDDLGADSLDTVELVMMFEEEFDIAVPEEDLLQIQTVADAIGLLEQQQKREELLSPTNKNELEDAAPWIIRIWRMIKQFFRRGNRTVE